MTRIPVMTKMVKTENPSVSPEIPPYSILNKRLVDRPLIFVRLFEFLIPRLKALRTRTKIGKLRFIDNGSEGPEVEIEIDSSILNEDSENPSPLIVRVRYDAEAQPTGNQYAFKHMKDSGYVAMLGSIRHRGPMCNPVNPEHIKRIEQLRKRYIQTKNPPRKIGLQITDQEPSPEETPLPKFKPQIKDKIRKRTDEEIIALLLQQFNTQNQWLLVDLASALGEPSARLGKLVERVAKYDQNTGLWTKSI